MTRFQDLDVRHLSALVAVADEGTFGRAADRLGFTQSAVSQQVAALERLVGLPLFDRPGGPRRPQLTAAGSLLLAHAREVLRQLDAAADELDALRRGVSGRLVVGTFQSVSHKIIPALVGQLRGELPDLDIRIFESDDQLHLLERLLSDELDLSFVVGCDDDDRIVLTHLGEDPYVLVRAAGSTDSGPVPTRLLDGAAMVGQPEGDICQTLIDSRLRDMAVSPTYVFRSRDNGAVQAMVRSGMGPAIMPYLAVDASDPGIEVCDLDPPIGPRRLGIASRIGRTLPPVASRFIEAAEAHCATTLGQRVLS